MKALLQQARKAKKLKSRELAQLLQIDPTLISRFESGTRLPTRNQVLQLAHFLDLDTDELLTLWLKEKIILELAHEPMATSALQMVNEEIGQYNVIRPISTDLQSVLNEIDELKKQLDKLRQYDSYRIAQALELEYTFESNRIEGNTLTLRETDLVINEGLTVSGKSMREHLEAINHKEAIEYVKGLVQKKIRITEREVLSIHNLILRGILPEEAGKYRNVQVMIKGSAHMPPPPFLVAKQMEDYFLWFQENKHKTHPVILAAEMHERLVTIHPFVDGNGRTSRLIMNLILLKNGYVIANIKGDLESRMKYYEALENVQTTQNKEAFHQLVAQVEKDCLNRYLSILKP